MKYRVLSIIVIIALAIGVVMTFVGYYSNKPLESTLYNLREIKNKEFSMYRINEDGKYEKYEGVLFPEGYKLDLEESYCVDIKENKIKGILTWNNGKVMVKSDKTVYCYLYFKIESDVKIKLRNGMPNVSSDTKTLSCSNASWNTEWDRLEISLNGSAPIECDLSLKPNTRKNTRLIDIIEDDSKLVSVGETGIVKESITTTTPVTDVGYRYEGKEPNNWIWFNNEYWRIIGSVPTKVDELGSIENVVKIIRNDSIGVHVWNKDTSTVAWGSNTLYSLLNNYYYGKKNATGVNPECLGYSTTSYAQCDYRGVGIDPESSYGKMIKDVYWNIYWANYNTSTVASYTEEIKDRTVKGKVGMMTMADFAYAAAARGTTAPTSYGTEVITKSNWLYSIAYEWTMTRHTNNYQIDCIDRHGIISYCNSNEGREVRPVVYLNTNVYVVSGDGTPENPYRVAL